MIDTSTFSALLTHAGEQVLDKERAPLYVDHVYEYLDAIQSCGLSTRSETCTDQGRLRMLTKKYL